MAEGFKHFFGILLELFLEDLSGFFLWEGRESILQLGQLQAVFWRKQIRTCGQGLS
eukprot:jgi/Pico_ML_1/55976/g1579.t1